MACLTCLSGCDWRVVLMWLRIAHSLIHCTYNRVIHRLAIFALSFALVVALWVAYVVALAGKSVV